MKKFSIFVASVILLAGCAKENPAPAPAPGPVPGPGGEDTPDLAISISPTIAEFTKATGTHFDAGDKIGLDILVDSEAEAFKTNAELTYQGTSFSAENLIWYKDAEKTSTLTAYYPYSESGRPATITVLADQSAGATSADILGATLSGVKPSESPVALTFKHLLSKVEIKIDNKTSEAVSAVSVKNLVAKADLNFSTLTSAAATDGTATEIKAQKISDDTYVILVPAQTGSFVFSVEQAGNSKDTESQPITLVSGKIHSAQLTIEEEKISVQLTGDIQDWENGQGFSFPVEYAGVTYQTVTLSNGQTWMAEPLRYVPDGKAATNDPNDGNGIWFPYKVVDGVAVPLTDKASIEKYGYLYDYPTALGATLTADNYSSFEGAQGICPDGWHLPTRAELIAICGASTKAADESAAITDKTAIFWDATASTDGYATVVKANEAGFNFTFSGSTQKNTPEAAGKYPTTVITANKTDIENSVGELAMTYLLGSTPYQWRAATATFSAYAQFFGMMTTFNSNFKKGKLSVSYTNERAGYSIRCIKDGWTAK